MSFFPRNGELRGSERWDSAAKAWIPDDEWQARQWAREDAAFARKMNQGQLAAPMVISDGQGGVRGLQSMVDGRHYDSKAAMRRHYRERGVTEIGNESPVLAKPKVDDNQARRAAIGRAMNRVGITA